MAGEKVTLARTGATFSTRDLRALITAILERAGLAGVVPQEVDVDYKDVPPTTDWLDAALRRMKRSGSAMWADRRIVSFEKDGVGVSGWVEPAPEAALAWVAALPCTLVTFSKAYDEWKQPALEPYAFAGHHALLGWGCAFKGAGHLDLVSRRWLDHGPWRTLRGPDDTTLIQFHDLALGWEDALAIANPAHTRLMAGFLRVPYTVGTEIRGAYAPSERLLKIVVVDREVAIGEMRDACAVRRARLHDREAPLANIAYVFMDQAAARAHLHELWMHGLECRALIDGREVRLDEDYAPSPG